MRLFWIFGGNLFFKCKILVQYKFHIILKNIQSHHTFISIFDLVEEHISLLLLYWVMMSVRVKYFTHSSVRFADLLVCCLWMLNWTVIEYEVLMIWQDILKEWIQPSFSNCLSSSNFSLDNEAYLFFHYQSWLSA